MASTVNQTLYYQIVLDATSAIEALRQFGEAGADFEAIVKNDETFINQLMQTYDADAGVIASVMKKMNSDISASNRERIRSTVEGEAEIKLALDGERQAYVALDAAISQAAKNVQAGAIPTAGTPTDFNAVAREANDFMVAVKAAGLTFDETMSAMRIEVRALMDEFGLDAPVAEAALKGVEGSATMSEESLNNLSKNLALQQLGRDMQEDTSKGIELGSTLRMIEGVIVSMAVFQGIQMISQALSDAVKYATDYYQALQNITVAQSALAQQGVNVTNQQLLDIVDQLHQKWQTISQTDITQAVSQAGLMASEYHLSVEQMTQLANEAAILHQLDPSKPMADYVVQLAKALEGGRSLALNGEQIAITTEELKNKAVELGLIQANSKAALTDQQKVVAGLAIEYERLHPEEAKLTQEIQNGTSSLVQNEIATAKWKDMMTALGEPLKNTVDSLKIIGVQIMEIILNADNWWNKTTTIVGVYVAMMPVVREIAGLIYAISQLMEGNVHSAQDFFKALSDGQTVLAQMIAKLGEMRNIQDWTKLSQSAAQRSGLDFTNTPTGPGQDVTGASTIDESKLTSILDSVAKDYQSYYDGVQKATESFDLKMQDMQDQYNLNVQKEIQDVNLRMSQEKENFRLKQLQQEQDFQQKMKDLTARYLLDLEDALRKRDAEAVIKIIERYDMEKTTAAQQEQLKQQQDQQQERLKLEQMKQEENLRLSQMKAEFDLQKTEATRAYNQQLADLRTSLDNKLQEEAVKAQQELGLNTTSIEAIYKLFTTYYGPNGKFAQEQQGAYTKMIEQSQGFVDQMAAIMQGYTAVLNSMGTGATEGMVGSTNSGYYRGGGGTTATTPAPKRFAAGGMALAASATDVTFGEAGPELAMFLPLNSAGSPSMSGVGGGMLGSVGGQATIALALSPDLEARIVGTTLTHMAISIQKVYGTR